VITDIWTIPIILGSIREQDISKMHRNSIVDKSTFTTNWNTFTRGAFGPVDWTNVVVAGGAVLGCLLPNFISKEVIGVNGFHNSGTICFMRSHF
jgi:hypothetical protein